MCKFEQRIMLSGDHNSDLMSYQQLATTAGRVTLELLNYRSEHTFRCPVHIIYEKKKKVYPHKTSRKSDFKTNKI